MLKNKGVILITTLLFVSLIVMFSVLVAQQGKQAIQSGSMYSQNEQAYLAALSGIEYARSQLYDDKNWMSGSGGNAFESSSAPIKVEYNGKDIVGYLGYKIVSSGTSESNASETYNSYFSISFNPPASDQRLASYRPSVSSSDNKYCGYSSINNLSSAKSYIKSESNESDGYYRIDVPANSCYIVSRGVCGKSVRYVEALLTSDGPSVLDGGTTIAGSIDISGIDREDYNTDYNQINRYSASNRNKNKKKKDKDGNIYEQEDTSFFIVSTIGGVSANNIISFKERQINVDSQKSLVGLGEDASVLRLGEDSRVIAFTNAIELSKEGSPLFRKNITDSDGEPLDDVDELSDYANYLTLNNKDINFESKLAEDDMTSFEGVKTTYNGENKSFNTTISSGTYVYIKNGDSGGEWKFIDDLDDSMPLMVSEGNSGESAGEGLNVYDNINNSELNMKQLIEYINSKKNELTTPESTSEISFSSGVPWGNDNQPTVTVKGNVSSDGSLRFMVVEKIEDSDQYRLSSDTINFKMAGESPNKIEEWWNSLWGNVEKNQEANVSLVCDGDLDIYGEVNGYGNIYANGNLAFNSGSQLQSGKNNESLAIWADKNIYIKPAFNISSADSVQTDESQEYINQKQFTSNYTFPEDQPGTQSDLVSLFSDGTSGEFILYINKKQVATLRALDDINYEILNVNEKNLSETLQNSQLDEYGFSHLQQFWVEYCQLNEDTKQEDYEQEKILFRNAEQSQFRGTIYSNNGNIFINGGESSFYIQGAIIAKSGDLTIKNMKTVTLDYDPEYVPFFKDLGVRTAAKFISVFN